jgi:hypothetical protein
MLGENVRKGREGRLQQTYRVGRLPIATEASRACRAKTNCDGGGSADIGNARVRWETVTFTVRCPALLGHIPAVHHTCLPFCLAPGHVPVHAPHSRDRQPVGVSVVHDGGVPVIFVRVEVIILFI